MYTNGNKRGNRSVTPTSTNMYYVRIMSQLQLKSAKGTNSALQTSYHTNKGHTTDLNCPQQLLPGMQVNTGT